MNISHWLKKLGALGSSYAMQVYALGLVIGVGLVVGIGLQVAQAWTAPSGSPPDNGNISAPITTSSVLQTKMGSFGTNGNLIVIGTIDTTGKIVNNWTSSNWDVWLQGGSISATGGARNLAVAGNTFNDTLYINYQGEYAGGTVIPKICFPDTANCRTSWPSGTGGVQSISAGAGITLTPNPITNTGTVAVNATSLTGCGNATTGKVYWNGSRFACATDQGSSYNDLPTGATAGYCEVNIPGNDGINAILPAVGAAGSGCSCVAGWVSRSTGDTPSIRVFVCIKN